MAKTTVQRANSAEVASKFFLAVYLGLGTTRSLRAVREIVTAMGLKISRQTLMRYSSTYGWGEEARKFDAARAAEAKNISIDQMLANGARRSQLGRLYQEMSIAELQKRQRLGDRLQPDSLSSIARIGEAGVKIERLEAGLATEIRNVMVDVYGVLIQQAGAVWVQAQDAAQAVYRAAGVEDEAVHAQAYNAAADVFAPQIDTLIRQHFTTLGINDVVLGEPTVTYEESEAE